MLVDFKVRCLSAITTSGEIMKVFAFMGLLLLASLNLGCGGPAKSSQTGTSTNPPSITSLQVLPSLASIAYG